MMVLALELENIKSYERASVEFTPGVNAIVGHNGAGKSTIVEAIGFVLFGALNYSQSDFLRSGAKSGTIMVAFLSGIDERRYEVTRRIGSSPQYYVFDPELQTRICEGRADVERFLYEHMRLEPGTDLSALFKDAVGVAQGTLTAAFLYSEANRRPIFDRLLQLEDYRTAAEKLREPARLVRDQKAGLDSEIAATRARLERLAGLEAEVAQDRASLEKLEAHRAELTAGLAEASARRAELDAAQDAVNATRQTLMQAEQTVAGLTLQEQAAAGGLEEAESARRIVEENQAGHAAYGAAQARQAELDAAADARRALTNQAAAADQEAALQGATVARHRDELVQIEAAAGKLAELAAPVARQEELEAQLGAAQREMARLETAEQQLQQHRASAGRLVKQRDKLVQDLAESQKLDVQRKEQGAALETLRLEMDEKRNELAGLKTRADSVKDQSKVLEQDFALCPVCEQPLAEAQRKALLGRNSEEIARLRRAYASVNNAMKGQETQADELRKRLEGIDAALRRAPRTEELARVEDDLANATRQEQTTRATVEALAGAGSVIAQLERELAQLGNPKQQHAIVAARAAQRQAAETRLADAVAHADKARAEAERFHRELAAFAELDAAIARVRADLQKYSAAYQAVLANARRAEEVEARMEALARVQAQLGTAQMQLTEAQQAAEEAAGRFDPHAYAQARESEQNLRTQLGVTENEAGNISARLTRQQAEIEVLQALARELTQKEARHDALSLQERALEKIRSLLRQAQPYIARALVRRISETAEQIFGDIMQDYSRHLQWSEDYGVTLRVDEHERQFAQLSGGEQMSAALAVRLALLREMSNIEVAFFDEPTANLDETRRESLARQILQVRGFRQLFVISHDDTFEQATQNIIRVERINGSSRAYSA